MNKIQFLKNLESKLSGLPKEDIQKTLDYYSEMIDDKIDSGLNEEDAVSELGNIDEIVSQIISETPLKKIIKEKVKTKRTLSAWEIILLILGAPLWVPLILLIIAVILFVWLILFAFMISVYALDFALAISGICFTFLIIPFSVMGFFPQGLFVSGTGLVLAGISILTFLLLNKIIKCIFLLTKNCWNILKKLMF